MTAPRGAVPATSAMVVAAVVGAAAGTPPGAVEPDPQAEIHTALNKTKVRSVDRCFIGSLLTDEKS
jgi:hypothetical protein